jgi:hypothetical protein
VLCCGEKDGWLTSRNARTKPAEGEEATLTGALAPTKPLTAADRCDRCGAQAFVRVLLPSTGELLFCAHHNRQHGPALAKVAVEIQDETERLSRVSEETREY